MLDRVIKMIEDMNVNLAEDLCKALGKGDDEMIHEVNAKQEVLFDLYYMVEKLQREEQN